MPDAARPAVGTVAWFDLTVSDALGVREFYQAVIGWTTSPVEMGGYEDFCMHPPEGGDPIAGVCHARGSNADLPAQWLAYIVVADLDSSLAACTTRGGAVLAGPKSMGTARYAVIRDPAGAVLALYQV
ncbi:MAG: VOC family protein [Gemmatimonadales bacterium]